jgi:hypothetical protein
LIIRLLFTVLAIICFSRWLIFLQLRVTVGYTTCQQICPCVGLKRICRGKLRWHVWIALVTRSFFILLNYFKHSKVNLFSSQIWKTPFPNIYDSLRFWIAFLIRKFERFSRLVKFWFTNSSRLVEIRLRISECKFSKLLGSNSPKIQQDWKRKLTFFFTNFADETDKIWFQNSRNQFENVII